MHRIAFITVLALTAAAGAVAIAAPDPITLPKDYSSWRHVRSMVIRDKAHALYGFHHVYVEPSAMPAYRDGKTHKEGALLAVPFFEVVEKDGVVDQGAFRMVAVMKKDKTAKDTGGWRYAAFGPDGKNLGVDPVTGCHNCHASQKDRDFIFSKLP